MKTTLDLPDPLMRKIKVRAAGEGRKLKDLVAEQSYLRLITTPKLIADH
jgi:plasmid stability protein